MLSVEDILQPENVSYTDNVWTWAVAHMLHKGEDWQITTITDTAPIEIVFLSKGEPLTDYIISGNTIQDGTPTPEAPVDVVGCGVRTKNLFDKVFASGYSLYQNGVPAAYSNDSRCATLEPIDVSDASVVTFSFTNAIQTDTKKYMYSLFDGSTLVTRVSNQESGSTIDVSQGNKLYLCVYSSLATVDSAETTTDIMLNTGSTALPYEPYGYKLPITCGGVTTPIYLGQVPTTRRIKKLVLTGEENWQSQISLWRNDMALFALQQNMSQIGKMTNRPSINTHFISVEAGVNPQYLDYVCSGYHPADVFSNFYYIRIDFITIGITSETIEADAITAFKAWLADQYAAGTPVTVWYVLATPETAVVNEPLMKIGDYADTVSMAQAGVGISTVAGTNTLTVDTTVQPSEVSITGNIKEVN